MVDPWRRSANSAWMRRLPRVLAAEPIRQNLRLRSLVPAAFGVAALSLTLTSCGTSSPPAPKADRVTGGPTGHYVVAAGIHKIKHVIVIEQENRSFDSYFGTYPGADGIPMENGPRVRATTGGRLPDAVPRHGRRQRRRPAQRQQRCGGRQRRGDERVHHAGRPTPRRAAPTRTIPPAPTRPRRTSWATTRRPRSRTTGPTPRTSSSTTTCSSRSTRGRSPTTSTWCRAGRPSARARSPRAARTRSVAPTRRPRCSSYVDQALDTGTADVTNAWTDITWLLYNQHVPWAYYVQTGDQPDCDERLGRHLPRR